MTSVNVTSTPFQVSVDDAGTSVTVSATGPAGPTGATGQGVPVGGSTGQVLKKSSGTNYDTEWGTAGTGDLLASNNLSDLANAGTARTNLGLGTSATAATGISNTNVPVFTSGVADDDFLRVSGTSIEGRSASEVLSDIGGADAVHTHAATQITSGELPVARGGTGSGNASDARTALGAQAALTFGISNTNAVKVDAADVADDEFARFTSSGLESRSASEVRSDIGLGTAATVDTGTGSSNAILGNDARLTDERTPADHSTDKLTSGTLPVARGGTGVTSIPMVALITAADAAAARTALGVTNVGSYTGQIETAADKTYTLDPGAATARTITGFYIKSGSGTVTAALNNGGATVKGSVSVSTSAQDLTTGFSNTSVSANGVLTLVLSSNSSATDVIFAVEYTE